jgi:putative flippase GtrA
MRAVPAPVRTRPQQSRISGTWGPERPRAVLQLARFGLTGALVFAVYTGGTLLLSGPLGVPIVAAIAMTYPVVVVIHFTMQRRFVFLDRDAFALPLKGKLLRYFTALICNYALTTALVITLPHALGVSQEIVFVGVVIVVSLLSFALLRGWIFHEPRSTAS